MPTTAITQAHPTAIRLLVVDDQQAEFVLLHEAFAAIGRPVELQTAGGMIDAWARLEAAHLAGALPALALIDVHLVLHSGTDLLAAMRDDPRFVRIPALMMTVDDGELANPRHAQLGALGVLRKPDAFAGYRHLAATVLDRIARPPVR